MHSSPAERGQVRTCMTKNIAWGIAVRVDTERNIPVGAITRCLMHPALSAEVAVAVGSPPSRPCSRAGLGKLVGGWRERGLSLAGIS